MSAVGHYLEEGGIPTASISLVREHTEAMAPPRALWVPFILGRPLGAPHDAGFQHQVLQDLLALFEAGSGPVLRDFAHDAPRPAPGDVPDAAACPVNFARPRPPAMEGDELGANLVEELDALRPWHALAVQRRGGSAVGLSGLTPEQVGAFLCAFAADRPLEGFRLEQPLAMALKQAADDLRAYCEEAAVAQPGGVGPQQMEDWFYRHTVAGRLLQAVRARAMAHPDGAVRAVGERALIPRAVLNRPQAT